MSDRVTYRNVKIVADRSVVNTDGFNPDSSQDVLVDGCFLLCGDDTIAIKSSGASNLLRNVERITVRNSQFITTTSAMKMGTESFADYHRDITFENNDVILADRAINLSCTDERNTRTSASLTSGSSASPARASGVRLRSTSTNACRASAAAAGFTASCSRISRSPRRAATIRAASPVTAPPATCAISGLKTSPSAGACGSTRRTRTSRSTISCPA